ncbi:MAG: hypothetical protein H7326_00120 [Bdellovibrionaceae bacterium]|nr:hypothetical protein [Pseudobdellovibrionaceae bacterium]
MHHAQEVVDDRRLPAAQHIAFKVPVDLNQLIKKLNWVQGTIPQRCRFTVALRQKGGDPMQIYHASAQWKAEPHDFQLMGFTNPINKDYFWSVSYSYNLNRYFTAGGFIQEYYGEIGTLHWLYRQITGEGLVAGVRLELNIDWAF